MLQDGGEIFNKPATSSNIENRQGTRDLQIPPHSFSAPAEIVHQQQVCFEVLGQDDRVVLASVKMRQTRVGRQRRPG